MYIDIRIQATVQDERKDATHTSYLHHRTTPHNQYTCKACDSVTICNIQKTIQPEESKLE